MLNANFVAAQLVLLIIMLLLLFCVLIIQVIQPCLTNTIITNIGVLTDTILLIKIDMILDSEIVIVRIHFPVFFFFRFFVYKVKALAKLQIFLLSCCKVCVYVVADLVERPTTLYLAPFINFHIFLLLIV